MKETNTAGAVRPINKFYDGMGREIQVKSESLNGTQNIVTDKVYDGLGQVTQQSQAATVSQSGTSFYSYLQLTDPLRPYLRLTTTSYDGVGRARSVTEPDASTTWMTYTVASGIGLQSVMTGDAKQHRTEHLSDMFGRLRQVVEYSGNNGTEGAWATYATTSYTYNPLDLLTNAQDGMGKNIVMKYDSLGRKTQMTDITMGTWNYQYNVDGSLQQQTDPKAQTISFQYDELARLVRKNYPDSSSSRYAYDQTGVVNGKGQRTSMGRYDASSVLQSGTSWTYTAQGQQATATYTVAGLTGTRAFSFGYDAASRNTSITYPNGETVGYGYDDAWHQYAMAYTLPGPITGNYVFSALYTALDQPTNISLGNNAGQIYSYTNTMARLINTQVAYGGTPLLNKSYQYDAVGNVQQISNSISSDTQNYTYDHRDRLASWSIGAASENYLYDVVGNIKQRAALTFTYDYTRASGNQGGPYALRSYNGSSFTYDGNGNMTADGTRTYSWSAENLPTSIVSGGVTETYSYDAEGERVKKVRGAVTTYYIGGLYEEQVSSLSTTYRYYYTFSGQTVAQREYVVNTGSNTVKYLHGDHLGSVSLVTSSTGASAGVQEFDPWGKVRSGGTVGTQTVMNYTGQKLDGTGLLYYHARMYDPSVGRFVSPDSNVPEASKALEVDMHSAHNTRIQDGPAEPQAFNRYAYVLNNPMSFNDPSGHEARARIPGTLPRTFRAMLGLTYQTMMGIIGASGAPDPMFTVIQKTLQGDPSTYRPNSNPYSNALALWSAEVREGGRWDMKSTLSYAVLGRDHRPNDPSDDIWFHMPGDPSNTLSDFNVFGNVMYGFIGAAAGFSLTVLGIGAGAYDTFKYGAPNPEDDAAAAFGYGLYQEYKDHLSDLTYEVFERRFLEQQHKMTHKDKDSICRSQGAC